MNDTFYKDDCIRRYVQNTYMSDEEIKDSIVSYYAKNKDKLKDLDYIEIYNAWSYDNSMGFMENDVAYTIKIIQNIQKLIEKKLL